MTGKTIIIIIITSRKKFFFNYKKLNVILPFSTVVCSCFNLNSKSLCTCTGFRRQKSTSQLSRSGWCVSVCQGWRWRSKSFRTDLVKDTETRHLPCTRSYIRCDCRHRYRRGTWGPNIGIYTVGMRLGRLHPRDSGPFHRPLLKNTKKQRFGYYVITLCTYLLRL